MHFIYFDIETERIADEVGGWTNIEQLGVAIGVTLSSRDNEYRIYRSHEVEAMLTELRAADCVVGFNIRNFDFRVMQPYVNFDVASLPHLDLMLDLRSVAGFRPSLNNCCGATLGSAKSGDGLQSIAWWREGQHEKVIDYCKQDVLLTRQLHEFGAREKYVKCLDKSGRTRTLTVDWSLESIRQPPQQGSLF